MFLMVLGLSVVISFILYLMMFIISYNVSNSTKLSPFESGFSSIGRMSTSFSVHFFMILLLFVIFDLELVVLMGLLFNLGMSIINFLIIMLFIVGSLYYEWYLGKLQWMV